MSGKELQQGFGSRVVPWLFHVVAIAVIVVLVTLAATGSFSQNTPIHGNLEPAKRQHYGREPEQSLLRAEYHFHETDGFPYHRVVERIRETVSSEILEDPTPPITAADSTPAPVDSQGEALAQYIEHVFYIDLTPEEGAQSDIKAELAKLKLPPTVKRERLSLMQRTEGALGLFLSHIAVLSKALPLKKNVLILENNVTFHVTGASLLAQLEQLPTARWNVLCLTEYARQRQPFGSVRRLIDHTDTCAYVVNRDYVARMLTYYIERMRYILKSTEFKPDFHLSAVQCALQQNDMWLGFNPPCGHKLPRRVMSRSIINLAPFVPQRVLIVLLEDDPQLRVDMQAHFLKGHEINFHVCNPRQHPLEPLYLYHHLTELDAHSYDYIYYVQSGMRLYQHSFHNLLKPGLVGTAHSCNLLPGPLPVERSQRSTAGFLESEQPTTYFARHFQGGKAASYVEAAQALRLMIDADREQNYMPAKGDEAYWNRYLFQHPPRLVLTQSYVFNTKCLDDNCFDPICEALRVGMHRPVLTTS